MGLLSSDEVSDLVELRGFWELMLWWPTRGSPQAHHHFTSNNRDDGLSEHRRRISHDCQS